MTGGRITIITGATRGLGRAMVDEFSRAGWTVLGCGRSEREVEQLRERFDKPHDFYVVDVSSDEEVQSWASLILTHYGPPDLLINNAGVINRNAPLWDVPAQEFDAVVNINLKGVANLIRHFVPEMVRRKSGVVVNFSSGWGRSVDAEVAPYCATKWAIEGLTRALAEELPSGMAAVPFNPGIVNTEMLQSCFGASAGSYPSPAQWAKIAVPFLAQLGAKDNGKPLSVPESWH
jgi:NAD(P)-dependent dehydrogenase (short-subunit alcohol dehydrogenase family)